MDKLRSLNASVDELEQNSGDTLINLRNTHLSSVLARKLELLFETDRSITNYMDHVLHINAHSIITDTKKLD